MSIFFLLLVATFLIQATKSNIVSKFLIEWASVWSTFVSAIAAFFIVIMAVVTYWQERKIRLLTIRDKIEDWMINLYKIPGALGTWRKEEGTIPEQQYNTLKEVIDDSIKKYPEISRLAEKNIPEIKEAINDVGIALAFMHEELLKSPFNKDKFLEIFNSIADDAEEILRHEIKILWVYLHLVDVFASLMAPPFLIFSHPPPSYHSLFNARRNPSLTLPLRKGEDDPAYSYINRLIPICFPPS